MRVRVTSGTDSRRPATPLHGASEAEHVYARGLVRAQLLLALGCLVGFLVVAGVFAVVLLGVVQLDGVVVAGVPLPWLLHAYGFYPIIIVFALIYAHGARRNERRYRSLREPAA